METTTYKRWQDVPVEVLREWYLLRVARSSLREMELLCGVNHSTLHAFLRGAAPIYRTRYGLAMHFLSEHGVHEPAVEALDTLASYFPAEVRDDARKRMLYMLERSFTDAALDAPEWLSAMLDADRDV